MSNFHPTLNKAAIRWAEETILMLKVVLKKELANKNIDEAAQFAVKVAYSSICRPGWPGYLLSIELKKEFKKELSSYATVLSYEKNFALIDGFAVKAVSTAMSKIPKNHLMGYLNQGRGTQIQTKTIEGFLLNELKEIDDAKIAAKRAFYKFKKSQGMLKKHYINTNSLRNDPLSSILSIPKSANVEIPKYDIRVHLLASMNSSFGNLLRKAAPFAETNMRRILGNELYNKGKPVGFADKNERTLLIEVKSPGHAQLMSFRKTEILQKLKKSKNFQSILDIRFTVSKPKEGE
ncbi:DUF721 domain-containing protein [Sulfobacillus acidophilus]|uniref:DUF721 domain-containing protein n=1 Tax=Sulfobacillus acidophilus TaxID=53633 RepID=A0ABS3AWR1_9FIRM|nr:DUF721 domain-containing protein [Sulfobacillus acidophilus]